MDDAQKPFPWTAEMLAELAKIGEQVEKEKFDRRKIQEKYKKELAELVSLDSPDPEIAHQIYVISQLIHLYG